MSSKALHGELEPGATLMRIAYEAVSGLVVEDPSLRVEPAGLDGCLDAAHNVLLVGGAYEGEAVLRVPAGLARSFECVREGKQRAGKPALHVA